MRSHPKTAEQKPSRRRWRCRLPTLLLLVLSVSIPTTLVAVRMRTARRQQDAVAAIENSGGCVFYYHEEGTPLSWPSPPPPGPLWLRRLLGDDFFRTAVEARLESDADFKCLDRLDQLKRLCFCGTFTESGQMLIKRLRRPRDTTLTNYQVAGAGWEHITALTKLEDLDVSLTDIGDAELQQLEEMTHLRCLGLLATRITDAGLRHLAGLTSLERLYLGKTQIGDDGVERLKGLAQLKELGLGETRVTDAALKYLAGLKRLQRLELQFTHVSAEGVAKIARALPECDIDSTVAGTPHPHKSQPGESPITSDDPLPSP